MCGFQQSVIFKNSISHYLLLYLEYSDIRSMHPFYRFAAGTLSVIVCEVQLCSIVRKALCCRQFLFNIFECCSFRKYLRVNKRIPEGRLLCERHIEADLKVGVVSSNRCVIFPLAMLGKYEAEAGKHFSLLQALMGPHSWFSTLKRKTIKNCNQVQKIIVKMTKYHLVIIAVVVIV